MAESNCTSKFCNGCQTLKLASEWHRNKNTKDGLAHRCKSCAIAAGKKWREENPERHRANANRLNRQYAETNKSRAPITAAKCCARCKNEFPADGFPKKINAFDGLAPYCRECMRTRDRERDPVKRGVTAKRSRERNLDRIAKYQKAFYHRNREMFYANNRRRKARIVSVGGSHTAEDIEKLLERQKYRCAYCRRSIKKARHIDHKVPLKLGGSNDPSNLQALCPKCNLSKGAKDPLHFANSLGLLL